jgi:hypothetical protein
VTSWRRVLSEQHRGSSPSVPTEGSGWVERNWCTSYRSCKDRQVGGWTQVPSSTGPWQPVSMYPRDNWKFSHLQKYNQKDLGALHIAQRVRGKSHMKWGLGRLHTPTHKSPLCQSPPHKASTTVETKLVTPCRTTKGLFWRSKNTPERRPLNTDIQGFPVKGWLLRSPSCHRASNLPAALKASVTRGPDTNTNKTITHK